MKAVYTMKELTEKDRDRFWSKVDIKEPCDCWNWRGAKRDNHYGSFGKYIRGWRKYTVQLLAHRVAYYLHYGELPKDKLVCHSCDNGFCCNPAHLFLGSPRDNTQDMLKKSRNRRRDGEYNKNAKLTNHDVVIIKQLLRCGIRPTRIAVMFSVAQPTISNIKHGITWGFIH